VLSRDIEQTLHRALSLASERRHEYATLEHLLLALADDADAGPMLQACRVDLDKLRKDLTEFLDEDLAGLVTDRDADPKPTAGFQRVVQRAAIHVQSAGGNEASGADVLLALFTEQESHAVYFLQTVQQMTRADAVNYVTGRDGNSLAEVFDYPSTGEFAALLTWHLRSGTRPNGNPNRRGRPWSDREFSALCGVSARTVHSWVNGRSKPNKLQTVEHTLFGQNSQFEGWRKDIRKAHSNTSSALRAKEEDKKSEVEERESIGQRPAAYRFTTRGDKVDILPESPEVLDSEFAIDTYNELMTKARDLHDRLRRSNSAQRVCMSVEGLLEALNNGFDDLRPGLLLSRVRSIEADQIAFESEEARHELFADAFAKMDDTLQTARDLLAAFPIVRRIESERMALDLERKPDAVPVLREEMASIAVVAANSKAATDAALDALQKHDAAIGRATGTQQASLVADKLLVVRNFAGAVLSKIVDELGDLSAQSWQAIKKELPRYRSGCPHRPHLCLGRRNRRPYSRHCCSSARAQAPCKFLEQESLPAESTLTAMQQT
jgi:hypothetical protein